MATPLFTMASEPPAASYPLADDVAHICVHTNFITDKLVPPHVVSLTPCSRQNSRHSENKTTNIHRIKGLRIFLGNRWVGFEGGVWGKDAHACNSPLHPDWIWSELVPRSGIVGEIKITPWLFIFKDNRNDSWNSHTEASLIQQYMILNVSMMKHHCIIRKFLWLELHCHQCKNNGNYVKNIESD